MATTSPLRQRMIEDMTIRNLSQATQQCYIYAVRKFSRHFGKSPARLGVEDVRAYQLHLIAKKRSWSHINQTACTLRFFYGVTMGQEEAFERIVNSREPEKLPPVLTPEEIARFLEAVAGLWNRVALTTPRCPHTHSRAETTKESLLESLRGCAATVVRRPDQETARGLEDPETARRPRGMASRQKVGDQPGLDVDIHAANRALIDDVGATVEKIERPALPHNKPNHPLPSQRIAG